MTPRIIVEGMDGSGKSTLTKQLHEWIGEDKSVIHRNEKGPREDLESWWFQQLNDDSNLVAIHDRFFYPEMVYGPILRGKVNVSSGAIDYVSKYLRSFAFLIYCRPQGEVISRGAIGRKQWPGVLENFAALLAAYDNIMISEMGWYGARFFRYDYQEEFSEDVLKERLEAYLYGKHP